MTPQPELASRFRAAHVSASTRAMAVMVFCALVWLNQGATGAEYERLYADVHERPFADLVQTVHFPLRFLYRRASDEELYHATASAILGRDRDDSILANQRGAQPDRFAQLPPPDGEWHTPYAEVLVEYPAPMLPFILGPALATSSFAGYARLFGAVMGLCLVFACVACIRAGGDGRDPRLRSDRYWMATALLLAQGALAIQRLDALVALCLGAALLCSVRKWPARLGVALGTAASLKFVPLLLAVPLLASDRAFRERAFLRRFAAGLVGMLALGLGSNFLFSTTALFDVLGFHAERGLQIESTVAVLLGLGARLSGGHASIVHAYGGMNLAGPAADTAARASGALMLAAVGAVAMLAWRSGPRGLTGDGSARTDRIAMTLLLGIVALWLTAKVFSPQYLTWALPLPLALNARRLRIVAWTLVGVMAISQLYMRGYYAEIVEQSFVGLGTLAVRLVALLALGAYLVRQLREDQRSPRVSAS